MSTGVEVVVDLAESVGRSTTLSVLVFLINLVVTAIYLQVVPVKNG